MSTPISLAPIPDAIRQSKEKFLFSVVAATDGYLLLRCSIDVSPRPPGGPTEQLYLLDRSSSQWRTINVEGNSSLVRLFRPWLATIVRTDSEGQQPRGRNNERSFATDRLPNVQRQYANWAGKYNWFPGILTLQNLTDGRKIRIETNQEDSEIVWVGSGTVLYRVNDAIYQARITGDQIQDSVLVAKDDDVPEIHWVFSSK